MTLKENTGEPIPVQPSKAVEPAHLDITAASIAFGRDGNDMFPIDLKIFLKLSVEDKVRYINMLRERFHVTYRSISKMMRANSDPYISNWCNKMHRLEGTTFTVFPKGEEPDAEQRHQWNSWLQKNHWTTGFVKVNEKTSATKKHRVKKAEKLVSETELIAHVESLGATMTTTEEAKVATKAVSSLTINTMTASTEEIENALEWVRSGLTFLKQPKVTITFTLEEV